MSRGRTFVQALYVAAALAAFFAAHVAMGITQAIPETSPTRPNPEAGLVYTFNNHGTLYYINRTEWIASGWGLFGAMITGFVMVGLYVLQFGFPTKETIEDHPAILVAFVVVLAIGVIRVFVT